MSAAPRVCIIGAGLAGLACARRLTEAGLACTVLERSDEVGGRARTDRKEGFQLDRGFQVFLSGYPEARRVLDYSALDLKPFHPGALIRFAGRFHQLTDPFRRPQDLVQTLINPIGTISDKYRLWRLRRDMLHHPNSSAQVPRSTAEVLQAYGFSDRILTSFFFPFLGGVLLESALATPGWIFEHIWGAFSRGTTALPRDGMGAIAKQLAGALPTGTVRVNQSVQEIHGLNLVLETGERLTSDVLVIATDDATAAHLHGESRPSHAARSSTTLYFDAPAPPHRGPWLMLNGEGYGPVRTVCVLSEAAPSYAPVGRALISVTVAEPIQGRENLPQAVQTCLRSWFGPSVDDWRHLRTDHISRALPPVEILPHSPHGTPPRAANGLYLCGDYRESGTLDGALLSGRKAADAVLTDFR
jgi:phytoene dehydrogenase-like protein